MTEVLGGDFIVGGEEVVGGGESVIEVLEVDVFNFVVLFPFIKPFFPVEFDFTVNTANEDNGE